MQRRGKLVKHWEAYEREALPSLRNSFAIQKAAELSHSAPKKRPETVDYKPTHTTFLVTITQPDIKVRVDIMANFRAAKYGVYAEYIPIVYTEKGIEDDLENLGNFIDFTVTKFDQRMPSLGRQSRSRMQGGSVTSPRSQGRRVALGQNRAVHSSRKSGGNTRNTRRDRRTDREGARMGGRSRRNKSHSRNNSQREETKFQVTIYQVVTNNLELIDINMRYTWYDLAKYFDTPDTFEWDGQPKTGNSHEQLLKKICSQDIVADGIIQSAGSSVDFITKIWLCPHNFTPSSFEPVISWVASIKSDPKLYEVSINNILDDVDRHIKERMEDDYFGVSHPIKFRKSRNRRHRIGDKSTDSTSPYSNDTFIKDFSASVKQSPSSPDPPRRFTKQHRNSTRQQTLDYAPQESTDTTSERTATRRHTGYTTITPDEQYSQRKITPRVNERKITEAEQAPATRVRSSTRYKSEHAYEDYLRNKILQKVHNFLDEPEKPSILYEKLRYVESM
jgi:hypothetical protein